MRCTISFAGASKSLAAAVLASCTLAFASAVSADDGGISILPQPSRVLRTEGEFVLKRQSDVRWTSDSSLPKEGYRLKVSGNGVEVWHSDHAGRVYALQTLKQLSNDACRDALVLTCPAKLPCCEIEDSPKFPWRGYMLDTSRHFFDKDVIKRAIDAIVYHKLNVFHWHLIDGSGWRFPVSAYPALTNECATRVNIPRVASWNRDDRLGKYGPFFHSREDIAEVLAYAKARAVEVVPEVDIPGHQGIHETFKFACCQSGLKPVGTNKWHYAKGDMCVGNPEAFRFYEKVFDELCEVFPSKVIHIGGDEVGGKDWAVCPRCQEVMRRRGLKTQRELQNVVMRHFADYMAKKGRRVIGWDEILVGGEMPQDAMMTHYHGPVSLSALAAGHDMVMMPSSTTYFDCEQDVKGDHFDVYQVFNSRLSWKRAYKYDPCAGVPEKDRIHVLGIQGCSWTEIVCNEEDLDWSVHPRLACIAEIGWSYPAKRDVDAFEPRLAAHRERLVRMGIGAAPLGPLVSNVPEIKPTPAVVDLKGFAVALTPQVTERIVDWVDDASVPAGGYAISITAKKMQECPRIEVRHSDAAGKRLALDVLRQVSTPKHTGAFYIPKGIIRSF